MCDSRHTVATDRRPCPSIRLRWPPEPAEIQLVCCLSAAPRTRTSAKPIQLQKPTAHAHLCVRHAGTRRCQTRQEFTQQAPGGALVLCDKERVPVDVDEGGDDVEGRGVMQAGVVQLDRGRRPCLRGLQHRVRALDLVAPSGAARRLAHLREEAAARAVRILLHMLSD